jgi:hypothetical protein
MRSSLSAMKPTAPTMLLLIAVPSVAASHVVHVTHSGTVDFSLDPSTGARRTCLGSTNYSTWEWLGLPKLFNNLQTVRVQVSPWASSRAVTALADIIMREVLDYPVTVRNFSDTDTYGHLAAGDVDVNFELWPTLPAKQSEKTAAQRLVCGAGRMQSPCITFKGGVGYRARSGWFVPLASIPNDMVLELQRVGFRHANGTVVYEEPLPNATVRSDVLSRGLWQSLQFVTTSAVRNRFVTVDELPVLNTCTLLGVHDAAALAASPALGQAGTYDCATGTWTAHNAPCCGRGDACASGLPRCLALAVSSPLYDRGFNELIVAQSGLPIQIVYADTAAAVASAVALSKPLLVYAWEPDAFTVTSGPFIRVSMTPYELCTPSVPNNASELPPLGSNTNMHVVGSAAAACDFPFQPVEKANVAFVERLSDVNIFVSRFNLSHTQVRSAPPRCPPRCSAPLPDRRPHPPSPSLARALSHHPWPAPSLTIPGSGDVADDGVARRFAQCVRGERVRRRPVAERVRLGACEPRHDRVLDCRPPGRAARAPRLHLSGCRRHLDVGARADVALREWDARVGAHAKEDQERGVRRRP